VSLAEWFRRVYFSLFPRPARVGGHFYDLPRSAGTRADVHGEPLPSRVQHLEDVDVWWWRFSNQWVLR